MCIDQRSVLWFFDWRIRWRTFRCCHCCLAIDIRAVSLKPWSFSILLYFFLLFFNFCLLLNIFHSFLVSNFEHNCNFPINRAKLQFQLYFIKSHHISIQYSPQIIRHPSYQLSLPRFILRYQPQQQLRLHSRVYLTFAIIVRLCFERERLVELCATILRLNCCSLALQRFISRSPE